MANTSRVNGLRPTKYLNGAAWNGQANLYFIPSGDGTATFVGDLVKAETTGDPAGSGGQALGVPSCVQGTAGAAAIGVIVGFLPVYTNLNSPQYRLASTGRYCWVVDDPAVIFEIQSNGSNAPGDVNNNGDVVVGAGSVLTGQSGMQMNATTAGTATFPFKVMGASQRQDNDITSANAKWLVKINNHQLSAGTGTAGV